MADHGSAHHQPHPGNPAGEEAYAMQRFTELRQLLENGEIPVSEVLKTLAEINFYIERYRWSDYDAQLLANYNFASICLSIRSERREAISDFTRDFVVNGVRACEQRVSDKLHQTKTQKSSLANLAMEQIPLQNSSADTGQNQSGVSVELELLETVEKQTPKGGAHPGRGANSEIGFMHRARYPGHNS